MQIRKQREAERAFACEYISQRMIPSVAEVYGKGAGKTVGSCLRTWSRRLQLFGHGLQGTDSSLHVLLVVSQVMIRVRYIHVM